MRFSLYAAARGLLLVGVALGATAVALGRLAPPPTPGRFILKPSYVGINGYHFYKGGSDNLLLDPDSGSFSRMALPAGDSLDYAVTSPWQDDAGERQVVGRWTSRTTGEGVTLGFGLGRYTYPKGQVLNRVPLDVMPIGVPCFFPGRSARVLFAAGDGRLYRLEFEDERGLPCSGGDGEARPAALTWRTDLAGEPPQAIADPIWPRDPRFADRLLVSVTKLVRRRGARPQMRTEIWWLRVDARATEIIAAGPLHPRDDVMGTELDPEETLPNLAQTADGDLVLAYLLRREDEAGWELRVVSIDVEEKTGNPVMDPARSVKIAGSRLHTLPIFSGDGRWVYSLPLQTSCPERPERGAVPPRFGSPSMPGRHLATRVARAGWN